MIDKERQPVIVGVGRFTQFPQPVEQCVTPVGMLQESARRAAVDAVGPHHSSALLADLIAVATPGMFTETRWRAVFGKADPMYKNFSQSVATALHAHKVTPKFCIRSWPGGNGPQYLMNTIAELIANNDIPQGPILIGGVEENSTFDRAVRAGDKQKLKQAGWGDHGIHSSPLPSHEPTTVNRHGVVPETMYNVQRQMVAHMGTATVDMYAHFENAYQHSLPASPQEHLDNITELFSKYSIVAASQPEHSWFPTARSQAYLQTVTKENRRMATPYNKWMIARDEIDQSAAFLVMSWAEAERRQIPEEKLIFLWGSGDAFDASTIPCRTHFNESKAMTAAYTEAFRSAGLGAPHHSKVACMDLYSCYPIAVELACAALQCDPLQVEVTKLTTTGGLPYHGGPGNNYASHSIVSLCEKLRLSHYRNQFGLVGANGGILTKHGVGIYSTKPPLQNYTRRDYREYEQEGGWALPVEQYALAPNGRGRILSWTVRYNRKPNVPLCGVVVGEMISGTDTGKRFCAMTQEDDRKSVDWLMGGDRVGQEVRVACDGKLQAYGRSGKIYKNYFVGGGVGVVAKM